MPMPRKAIRYKGPHEAIRLPVGMLVERPEDDDRPAYLVERGETISVEAEFAAVLLEADSWSKARGKGLPTSREPSAQVLDDGSDDGSEDDELEPDETEDDELEPDETEEPAETGSSSTDTSSEEG